MADHPTPFLSWTWPYYRPTKRLKFVFDMIECAVGYALEDCQFDFDKINWEMVLDDFLFRKEAGLTPRITQHFRHLYEIDQDRVIAELYLIIRRLKRRCAKERPDLYPQIL
jgi:hypothetical protein